MASLHGETDEQEGRSVEGWMDFLWTLRKEPTEQGCLGKAQESLETQSYAHLQGKQVFKDKRPRCRCAEVREIIRGQCGEGRTQRGGELHRHCVGLHWHFLAEK